MTNEEAVERLRDLVDAIKNSDWYQTNWWPKWGMDGKSILIENTTGPLSIDSQDDVSFD